MNPDDVIWREPGAPDWQSATIDGARYTAPERLRAELARVFARTWQLAGFTDQLAAPGDFLACEVAGESILVVNAGSSGLQAFYNVCRHRGRELVEPGACGQARSLRCPYHGWTYGLDGRLRGVPDAEAFPGLDAGAIALAPVEVATWDGFVFVALDSGGERLADYLAPLTEVLGAAFAPAVLVSANTYDIAANWKTTLEAFIETNHITTLHPRVGKNLDFDATAIAHFRRHSMSVIPSVRATDWPERRQRRWSEWGDDAGATEAHYSIFPNCSVHLFAMGLTFLLRYVPHRDDPERTRLDVWIWKRVAPGETPPARLSMPDAFGAILAQDRDNVVRVQRGVRSRAFAGPRLNCFESRIGHFHAVLDAML